MTPTDCSALRVYAPLRSALNVRPLDAQRPTILPLYSYSMGPLVSPAGSVVTKRVPLARSNPLHTNIGACKESIAPLASKLAVEHGFLHWSHKCPEWIRFIFSTIPGDKKEHYGMSMLFAETLK